MNKSALGDSHWRDKAKKQPMGSPITARVRYQVVLGASGGSLLLPAIWGWVIFASTGGGRRRNAHASQRLARHDRRPRLWRPGFSRQSQGPHAEPRSPGAGERATHVVLRLTRLLADARQPLDRPVQLAHGGRGYLPRTVPDAPGRSNSRRDVGRRWLSHRDLRQVAPG